MLAIDGSQGEGGGQVLRTALALSLVTQTPFRIERIRARRRKPGLMRQHLAAVRAAAQVGRSKVRGDQIGSLELTFEPEDVVPGEYRFSVGSAGSATLVLQTVLPALLTASGPSRLSLEGGTHNPLAPPFDFIRSSFLPLVNRMGPNVRAVLERPGFYPAGGGRFTAEISPSPGLAPLHIRQRGSLRGYRAVATIAGLPKHIAEREISSLRQTLGWPDDCCSIEEVIAPIGPGNTLSVEVEWEHLTETFTAFGSRGVRAEDVASGLAEEVGRYLAADVPVGEHLADQLLLPLAIAGGGSFRSLPLTLHASTNIAVIHRFISVPIEVEEESLAACVVRFGGPA